MPYSSTQKPIKGQRRRIRTRPAKKAVVPLSFWRRAKKRSVFWGPMIIVRPIRKRICWFAGGVLDWMEEISSSIGREVGEGQERTLPIANLKRSVLSV